MLYQAGAYQSAKEGYERLYPKLKGRGAFLFEYGHCLHKLKEADASILLLKEASTRSCDPMILNIIGKNFQEKEEYAQAENGFCVLLTYCREGFIHITCWRSYMPRLDIYSPINSMKWRTWS